MGALTAQEQATVCAWAATLVPWPDGAQVTCGALSRTYDEAEFLAGCGSRLAQIPATCSVPVAQLEECVREVMDDLEDDFCDDDEEDDWDDEEECAAILACGSLPAPDSY